MPVSSFLTSVGRKIGEERKRASLTQIEAAKQIGFSYRYYQLIEAGGANLTLTSLFKIARFFEVGPEKLVR